MPSRFAEKTQRLAVARRAQAVLDAAQRDKYRRQFQAKDEGVVTNMGCWHCLGWPGSCCLCGETRRVDYYYDEPSWAWDYQDCECAACQRVRSQRRNLGIKRDECPPPRRRV